MSFNRVSAVLTFSFAATAIAGPFPLAFERARGESGSTAQVLSRGPHQTVVLQPDMAILHAGGSTLKMNLVGANPYAQAVLLDPLALHVHYLIGSPDRWQTDVPTYSRVEFRDIYPGIHIIFHGADSDAAKDGAASRTLASGQLEYDFLLDPGSDPSQIRLRFEGQESTLLDPNGNVVLRSSSGEWRHTAPRVSQLPRGARHAVTGRFVSRGPDEFTVDVGEYDHSQPLVIDPVLLYSTFLGGTGSDSATAIAVDSAGDAYVAGYTESLSFPEASGYRFGRPSGVDVFVAKMSPAGQLLYLTYLGGSGDDRAYGIAVDSSGSAIVTGSTYSSDFPIIAAAQPAPGGGQDAFVAKLSPAGSSLVFSTYLGGSGPDCANALAVDSQSNIYAAGQTSSVNFPVLNGLQRQLAGGMDAFIEKFSSSGARLYGTYLGGVADDRAAAIAVDANGNAYITGSTYSPNFPVLSAFQQTLGGGQDAFVAKINSTGAALVYSTYLGGRGGTVGAPETGAGIAVDSSGAAYIAGTTSSSNFPLSSPLLSSASLQTAFVTKLSAVGNALIYSTYLGGSSVNVANAIAVDSTGRAYLAGYTASTDFPTSAPLQASNAGGYDAFISRLTATGAGIDLSTYLGGSGDDAANAIAVDSAGGIYVTGQTQSIIFPTVAPIQVYALSAMNAWVEVLGTATPATMISPTPGSTLSGSSVTFQWSPGSGVTAYLLEIGSAPGATDIYGANQGANLSRTISNLPTDGRTIYVRLWSLLRGVWNNVDYLYTAVKPVSATMISPVPGSTLSGSSVTFQWTAGLAVTGYWLEVGSMPGATDIYGASQGAGLSHVITDLPTDGRTIYVRLWSFFATGPNNNMDYTYIAAQPSPPVAAVMTSPIPGSTLHGSSVTFQWSAGTGVSSYWLEVGTSPGATDVYGANQGAGLSLLVTGLPVDGRTLYVRLWSFIAANRNNIDYTYKTGP